MVDVGFQVAPKFDLFPAKEKWQMGKEEKILAYTIDSANDAKFFDNHEI